MSVALNPSCWGLLALLARDHDHRHRAEQREGGAGREIECAGTERGQTDPGPAGESPVRRRHKGCRLFMAGQHQLDGRAPQRLELRGYRLNAAKGAEAFAYQFW